MTEIDPMWPWRTGRHQNRTLYVQIGDEASREDVLIGVMDTPELAAMVVRAVSELQGQARMVEAHQW